MLTSSLQPRTCTTALTSVRRLGLVEREQRSRAGLQRREGGGRAKGNQRPTLGVGRGGGNRFFLQPDPSVFPALSKVSDWANGQAYEPATVSTFLQVADYYTVAQALAGNHTVVTHEVPSASVRRIKIPDACIGLGVKCMTPYQMLRQERARFVLGTGR